MDGVLMFAAAIGVSTYIRSLSEYTKSISILSSTVPRLASVGAALVIGKVPPAALRLMGS